MAAQLSRTTFPKPTNYVVGSDNTHRSALKSLVPCFFIDSLVFLPQLHQLLRAIALQLRVKFLSLLKELKYEGGERWKHEAVGNGVCMRAMTIFFGQLIDSIGGSMTIATEVHEVTEVSLKFGYLAVASAVATFFQVASWMVTGERQAARIRSLYLKSILRQDIGFFDDEINGGEVIERMSGDTILIQDAIGEKLRSWKFYTASGGILGRLCRSFPQGAAAHGGAIIFNPTISHFGCHPAQAGGQVFIPGTSILLGGSQHCGADNRLDKNREKQAMAKYNKSLSGAYKSGVQESLVSGLGLGTLMCILFCSYGFAFWYGGKTILDKGYTAGTVINVIFAVVISSL
ncbi:hypothetical protein V6N13_116241 [Hibiscus sabdariffa]